MKEVLIRKQVEIFVKEDTKVLKKTNLLNNFLRV